MYKCGYQLKLHSLNQPENLCTTMYFNTPLGAFGYFEVTHDISKYCKARVFSQIGKRTPIAVRFSTVGKLIVDVNMKHTQRNPSIVDTIGTVKLS